MNAYVDLLKRLWMETSPYTSPADLKAVVEVYASQFQGHDQHDSQEFFVVLEGEVDYAIGSSDNRRRMKKGDTLYLDAHLPHGATLAPGCDYAAALVIYH